MPIPCDCLKLPKTCQSLKAAQHQRRKLTLEFENELFGIHGIAYEVMPLPCHAILHYGAKAPNQRGGGFAKQRIGL